MKKIFQITMFVAFAIAPGLALAQASGSIVSNLYQGLKSEEVTSLQQKLQSEGYFPSDAALTGFFGSLTKKAVQDFQAAEGVEATGFVGPLTRKALESVSAGASLSQNSSLPETTQTSSGSITSNLYQGIKSPEVVFLQQRLQELGYFSPTTTPTNFFGSLTKAAVQAFQSARGIDATGYVGVLTRQALGITPSLDTTVSKSSRAACLADAARIHDASALSAKQAYDVGVAGAVKVRDDALAVAAAALLKAKNIASGTRDAALLSARSIADVTARTNTIDTAIATYTTAIKPATDANLVAQNTVLANYTSAVAKAQAVFDAAMQKIADEDQSIRASCPTN